MLPDYVFIGPTKSGTSWIDAYLRGRPEVVLPATLKETFFFDKRFDRGLPWYESFFDQNRKSRAFVEVAPSYFAKPQAARRLAEILPKAHVICTLRDPLDRAVSHYFHYLKCGEPDIGFDKMAAKHPTLLEAGLYYKNLLMWQELLGKDRVHVLLYDQMIKDLDSFCRNICTILNIPHEPPAAEIAEEKVNEAGVPRYRLLARLARVGADELRSMGAGRFVNRFRPLRQIVFGSAPAKERKQEIRRQALEYYRTFAPDYAKLEDLLGIDLSGWRRPAAAPARVTNRDLGKATTTVSG